MNLMFNGFAKGILMGGRREFGELRGRCGSVTLHGVVFFC